MRDKQIGFFRERVGKDSILECFRYLFKCFALILTHQFCKVLSTPKYTFMYVLYISFVIVGTLR